MSDVNEPSARRTAVAAIADQGVAALTNIAVVVCAARQSTAADFASFAVVYTVFALLLGAAALALLRDELRPGDTVLVKSSRDAGLRQLGEDLVDDVAEATP